MFTNGELAIQEFLNLPAWMLSSSVVLSSGDPEPGSKRVGSFDALQRMAAESLEVTLERMRSLVDTCLADDLNQQVRHVKKQSKKVRQQFQEHALAQIRLKSEWWLED